MSEIFDSIRRGAEQAIDVAKGEARPESFKTHTFRLMDVKAFRKKLGMTQEAFSLTYRIDINTLRQREQGARVPDGPAQVLIKVIDHEPEAVRRALQAA